jgi:hypothetical protein
MSEGAPSRLEMLTLAIHARLGDDSVVRLFGRAAMSEHAELRRVVWIPMPSQIDDAHQAGGRLVAGQPDRRVVSRRVRVAHVEAYGYAEDDETTDALLDDLIAAIDLTAPQTRFIGYDYPQHHENVDGATLRSSCFVLRMSFRFPVPEEISALKPIASATDVCGTTQPDGTVTPQP